MRKGEAEQDEPVIDEDSPEWDELNKRADAEKEEFKRIVLENPEETLKSASLREIREGIKIIDQQLQKDGVRPEERQRRNQELTQKIIAHKTGKQVPEDEERWAPSTGLYLRMILSQEGLTPLGFRPTASENLRARLGDYASTLRDSVSPRTFAKNLKESLSQGPHTGSGEK